MFFFFILVTVKGSLLQTENTVEREKNNPYISQNWFEESFNPSRLDLVIFFKTKFA